MSALNLIYQFGIDKFFETAKRVGLDGIVIPDLSIEEASPYIKEAKKNNIPIIFFQKIQN